MNAGTASRLLKWSCPVEGNPMESAVLKEQTGRDRKEQVAAFISCVVVPKNNNKDYGKPGVENVEDRAHPLA